MSKTAYSTALTANSAIISTTKKKHVWTRSHTVNKNVNAAELFQCLLHGSCDAVRLPHIYTHRETAAS